MIAAMEDAGIYSWLPCKVCGCYHRGEKVRPGPLGTNWNIDAVIECPDSPHHASAFYYAREWTQGTRDQIEHLPLFRRKGTNRLKG